MATETRKPRTDRETDRVSYRFTADEVLAFCDHLRHDAELWDGILYQVTKKEPHNLIVLLAAEMLRAAVPPTHHVREEKSCRDGKWPLPEPDVAVARGRPTDFYPDLPPLTAMSLLVEVNDHSGSTDHGPKRRRYAEAGVPVYWVIDVTKKCLIVHEAPAGEGESAGYGRRTTYSVGDLVPIVIDGVEVARAPVSELFPFEPETRGPGQD